MKKVMFLMFTTHCHVQCVYVLTKTLLLNARSQLAIVNARTVLN